MRNLILIFTLLALTACNYTFELKEADMKPMIAVQAKICADSSVVINVHKTVPLTQIGKMDTTLLHPHYSLLSNGTEVETTYEMDGEGGMIIKADFFKSGDKLDFTFSADDMETVNAVTVIPAAFPKNTVTLVASGNLQIAYEDDPEEDNYYAAIVTWRGQIGNYDTEGNLTPGHEITDGTIYIPRDLEAINLDPGAYSPKVSKLNEKYIYFWSDKDEEDNVYDLMYNYAYQADHILNREVGLSLISLSEDMYRTLFAEYDINSNPFANLGLSSPSFTYSNVRDGLGHFCSYSVTQSKWISDPVVR